MPKKTEKRVKGWAVIDSPKKLRLEWEFNSGATKYVICKAKSDARNYSQRSDLIIPVTIIYSTPSQGKGKKKLTK